MRYSNSTHLHFPKPPVSTMNVRSKENEDLYMESLSLSKHVAFLPTVASLSDYQIGQHSHRSIRGSNLSHNPFLHLLTMIPGMNTTAGSYTLLGSIVPEDATIVTKLRSAGAIILGAPAAFLILTKHVIMMTSKKAKPPCPNGLNTAETYRAAGQGEVANAQTRTFQLEIRAFRLLVLALQHLSVLQL